MLPEHSSQVDHAARNYIVTYLLLMVLLGLTWGAAYLPLGIFNLVISLGIACAKALLVVLVFMHVRKSPRLVWFFCRRRWVCADLWHYRNGHGAHQRSEATG